MKIHSLIDPRNVFLDIAAEDVRSALAAVAELWAPSLDLEADEVVEGLLEREALGSTSVGEGFAIPHCKLAGLRSIAISLARLRTGVEFGAGNGTPVSFMFVVLSPPDQPAAHLQVLSQIARVLKRGDLRTDLLAAATAAEVAKAVCDTAGAEGL
jgi:mannitol/fructose-specific phosphotransferase system IIA component (Ntr-type)